MKPKIYIDGKEGTTGLQIYDRLGKRDDIDLLLIDESKRKDTDERKKFLNAADIVFLCLPDAAAREAVSLIDNENTRIIDASTAHRVAPGWDYGFPELSSAQRARIAASKRVANPGCYATGFISLVHPLLVGGVLPQDAQISAHAVSGYTGAGKQAIGAYEKTPLPLDLESPRQYALTLSHKHLPEMQQISGLSVSPIFSPMICSYPQGMLVSIPLHMSQFSSKMTPEMLLDVYQAHYAGAKFVSVMPLCGETVLDDGFLPANALANTNMLEIFVCGNQQQVILTARLDNLGKGASGAAVQNMNLMLSLPEETGLCV